MEFESHEQFQEMVNEEVQKLAIQDVIRKPKRHNKLLEILRHPIISVLLGFILTGYIGTRLTQNYQKQEKKKMLQKEAFRHIREFNQTLSLRNTESRYLSSALTRHVDDELLLDKKKSYDIAVKEWNTNLMSHLLTIREYADARDPVFFEINIDYDLVPILRSIDYCLTEEFDAAISDDNYTHLDSLVCWFKKKNSEYYYAINLRQIINASRNCGNEITNLLFSWVAINLKSTDSTWIKNDFKMKSLLSRRCKSCKNMIIDSSLIIPPHRTALPMCFKPD